MNFYLAVVLGLKLIILLPGLYGFAESLPSIYLTAPVSSLYGASGILDNPKQSGRSWEREVGFKYYAGGGIELASGKAGLRVHGGASRKRGAKKSFKLNFRSEYGLSRFPINIFNRAKKTKKFVLRAGFNDSWNYDRDRGRNGQQQLATYVKDQISRDLFYEMGQPITKGIFVRVYINGKFFGLYNLVEAVDEDNLENSLVNEEEIVIMSSGELKNGQQHHWEELKSVAMSYSGGPKFFEALSDKVDVDNLATYVMLNFWLQNYDWPHHNWKAVKMGGKAPWHFLMWDVEYSFGSGAKGYRADIDMFSVVSERKGEFSKMLANVLLNRNFVELVWDKYKNFKYLLTKNSLETRFGRYYSSLAPHILGESKITGVRHRTSTLKRAYRKASEFAYARHREFEKHLANQLERTRKGADQIVCSSENYSHRVCAVGSGYSDALLLKQLSSSRCQEGVSWGWAGSSIWADKGCRAIFRLRR